MYGVPSRKRVLLLLPSEADPGRVRQRKRRERPDLGVLLANSNASLTCVLIHSEDRMRKKVGSVGGSTEV